MKYILIPLLIVLMAMAVISLVRGIIAFLKSTREDLERGDQQGATEMQLLQNKMMFNRIKYQGLAVLVVVILLAASR
ncbi:HIG1 domain-containing protein [Novosphingobium sp. EMRT-2]|uniref:HIG1 domain-containing protein n=1 Tax=Novosphingobium sp. EMRT-2 TaxID=2571749 RepID=UPI0010BD3E2A|nr:HIG1 domain-containing protein [Novosphingobium sp. EMRT-2]QCI94307.1 hypothetical protein FA702_12665 [Novosphingobium sp. EMRT-2]